MSRLYRISVAICRNSIEPPQQLAVTPSLSQDLLISLHFRLIYRFIDIDASIHLSLTAGAGRQVPADAAARQSPATAAATTRRAPTDNYRPIDTCNAQPYFVVPI